MYIMVNSRNKSGLGDEKTKILVFHEEKYDLMIVLLTSRSNSWCKFFFLNDVTNASPRAKFHCVNLHTGELFIFTCLSGKRRKISSLNRFILIHHVTAKTRD